MDENRMEVDVVIIGAGVAGLSAAIRLKQLSKENNQAIRVCVLEKSAEIGAHILSGAVIETRALDELLPTWRELKSPIHTEAKDDHFLWLSPKKAWRLPVPRPMKNQGNYLVNLGNVCRWLAEHAQACGVDIYPEFPVTDVITDEHNRVIGVQTSDRGRNKQGDKKSNFQPGMHLFAKQIMVAEGCHGSLTQQLIKRFNLRTSSHPQTYALGIKEVWEIDPQHHQLGRVIHTIGWPLDNKTYGGSFLYHMQDHRLSLGLVVGLDYQHPYLDPFLELQRLKLHPALNFLFKKGKRIAYGAKTLVEGGWQALPKLSFNGGVLIGDCAGFLNVPKIKGTHTAMKSAIVAAETIFDVLFADGTTKDYLPRLKKTWLYDELYQVRNVRPAFRFGLWAGMSYAALTTYLTRGREPWTLKHRPDHTCLQRADQYQLIDYPKPDGVITFDRASSVYLSNVHHEEDQPCHLQLTDPNVPVELNLAQYDFPEQRYCPAGVYEIVREEGRVPRLQINASNCIHCKTCDIKDPSQNIHWVPPEGGGGPNYSDM